MTDSPPDDLRSLIRDKYDGTAPANLSADLARLQAGEPLAYVIGWQPFLGLRLSLDSKPLIPRPETEWWTERLIAHLRNRFDSHPFDLLDLCAGSGAIGLAVLKHVPSAHVSLGELVPEHVTGIKMNLLNNELDAQRAAIRAGDLFEPFAGERFSVIAANPPYIPTHRTLETSVTAHEPTESLFSGSDGLDLIRRIAAQAASHLMPGGELWLECDISNIEQASALVCSGGATGAHIHTDQYGRPRLVVAYY